MPQSSELRKALDAALAVALFAAAWTHVVVAPYTKVEESFSLQAVHDFLAYGFRPRLLSQYDHATFPGAVPRSFVGPLILAVASFRPLMALRAVNLLRTSADTGLAVRLFLATSYVASIAAFAWFIFDTGSLGATLLRRSTVQTTRRLFYAISIVQFHTLFWAGRTTPNGVVMPLVNVALGFVLTSRDILMPIGSDLLGLGLLTMAAVVSRMELVGLILPVALLIFVRRTSKSTSAGKKSEASAPPTTPTRVVVKMFSTCASFGLLALAAVVILDTPLWGRGYDLWNPFSKSSSQQRGFAWPELESLLFNVVEGKSEEWGTSPWHSYVTQHVPKLISHPILALVVLGVVSTGEKHLRNLVMIIAAHVIVLSQLRHKETRFIAYLAPLLNVLAAHGAAQLWQGRLVTLATSRLITRALLLAILSSTLAMTAIALIASAGNYPGGEALAKLHALRGDRNATVHIDVLPAMTGVSLFQSIFHPQHTSENNGLGSEFYPSVLPAAQPIGASPIHWTYDKTENLFDKRGASGKAAALIRSFDFIVSDDRQCHGLPDFRLIQGEAQARPLAFGEFAHLRLRKPRAYVARLRDALRTGFKDTTAQTLLPIEVERRDAVWLCERKRKSW